MQTRAGEIERTDGDPGRRRSIVLDMEDAHRPSRQLDDLQGTDDPPPVAGMEPGRRHRIEGRQPVVDRGVTVFVGLVLQTPAKREVGIGPLEQPAQQRLEIQSRTSHEQRPFAPPLDVQDGGSRPLAIRRDAGGFPGLDDVDQVVRDSAALVDRRLARADIHAAVQGRRVECDHLRAQPPRQSDTDRRLARSRRPREVDRAMKRVFADRLVHCAPGPSNRRNPLSPPERQM